LFSSSSVCPEHSMPFKLPCTARVFLLERLSNHCQGLHKNLCEIYTKFDVVPFSESSRNRIRSHTSLHKRGRKDGYIHPAAWNVVHWLQIYASSIIALV
jgi:hypothetical protein